MEFDMETMAASVGVSVPVLRFLLCFVATIPVGFLWRLVPGRLPKHVYSAFSGALLSYLSFGFSSNLHFLVPILLGYAAMVLYRPKCGIITFFLAFGYLIGWVDLLLGGGIRVGQLTELVGPSASGKTQVCLQTASNVARNYMMLYLDTGNSFSPQRIAYFLGKTNELASAQAKNQILQKVMSNILCHSVFDIFAMFDVLHQLESNLRCQERGGGCRIRLLIVDSISLLIAPVLGGTSTRGRALMASAGYLLKKLAHQHNLAVLVINHTVGSEGGTSKPALGDSWKSIPHSRLLLSCDRGSNVYNVSILKHPSMASGKAARFVI